MRNEDVIKNVRRETDGTRPAGYMIIYKKRYVIESQLWRKKVIDK